VRAVRFDRFGPPEQLTLRDVADPEPPPGQVVVRVHAAAVNHLDLDERAGASGFALHAEHQLGREGAGEVVATAADVDAGWIGRRVLVSAYPPCGTCQWCGRGLINVCARPRRPGIEVPGTYAERVAVPVSGIIPVPDGVPDDQASSAQLGLGTAWHALLRRGGLQAGDTVLVTGAGGGVGSAAVQVAAYAGAMVIAVARHPLRRQLAAELGAGALVDPTDGPVDEQVRGITHGAGVDIVLDAVGGDFLDTGIACLRPTGRYVLYGAHGGERPAVDLIGLFRSYGAVVASRGWTLEDLERVLRGMDEGRLRVVIGRRLPLADATTAHRLLAAGDVVGNLVLQP